MKRKAGTEGRSKREGREAERKTETERGDERRKEGRKEGKNIKKLEQCMVIRKWMIF